MRAEDRRLAILALVFLVIGGFGAWNPLGILDFLATECSPTGDCASYLAPLAASVVLLGIGVVLALVVGVQEVRQRL